MGDLGNKRVTAPGRPVTKDSTWIKQPGVRIVSKIIGVMEERLRPALNVQMAKEWLLERELVRKPVLGSHVGRDRNWIRARVVKTVQRITGAMQGTQLVPVLPVQQEKGWTLDLGNKRVTAPGRPVTKDSTWIKQPGVRIVSKIIGVMEERLRPAPNVQMVKEWLLERELVRTPALGSHVRRDKNWIRARVVKTVQRITGAMQGTRLVPVLPVQQEKGWTL